MNNPSYGQRRTVALIYGGAGAESEVSLMGREYVSGLIDRRAYRVVEIFIDRIGTWHRHDNSTETYPMRERGVSGIYTPEGVEKIDVALPLLHGDFGEDGVIQGTLESAGIPYLGADNYCGAVCADKAYTKAVAGSLGIPVTKGIYITEGCDPEAVRKRAEEAVGYPMFIKPARLGSSIGIERVACKEDFIPAFNRAAAISPRLLIEEEIRQKRELEVAYFSALGRTIITDPGEVLSEGFYGYDEKYGSHSATTLDKAELSPELTVRIKDYSRRLAAAVGLRHLGRIDFFLSGEKIIFNEINTMPGFTPTSLYPRLMSRAGIPPEELLSLLIEDAAVGGAE